MTKETPAGHPENVFVPAVAKASHTMEEVDSALLDEAQQLLGYGTSGDTIDRALGELILERRRVLAAEAQLRRFETGQFAVLRSTRELS